MQGRLEKRNLLITLQIKIIGNIVSINFVLEPKYKTILSDGYAVEDIIKNISMIDTSKKIHRGRHIDYL